MQNIKDKLSHLTFIQACKLLGPQKQGPSHGAETACPGLHSGNGKYAEGKPFGRAVLPGKQPFFQLVDPALSFAGCHNPRIPANKAPNGPIMPFHDIFQPDGIVQYKTQRIGRSTIPQSHDLSGREQAAQ